MSKHLVDYVFIHGGGQGGWIWEETISALHRQTSNSFARTLALDVPGCGAKRERDTANIDIDGVADELLADIEAAKLSDIILVGHSQAGTVMPLLAKKQPTLFHRLVYVSCSIPYPGQTVIQMMGTGLHGSNEDEVGWLIDPKSGNRRDHYGPMFCNDMSEIDAAQLLQKLGKDQWPERTYAASDWQCDHLSGVSSTYVVCLKDNVLPVAWQEIFASRFKVKRLVWVDAGHQVMISRPHTLAEILRHEAL